MRGGLPEGDLDRLHHGDEPRLARRPPARRPLSRADAHIPTDVDVAAADGFGLRGTLHEPPGAPRAAILVAPAMGARRRYYGDFAAYLSGRGAAVLTLDYRGIGDSRPRSLRGFAARLTDWGENDLEGGLRFLLDRHAGLPLRVVTHSVGGQVLGLAPSAARIDCALFVASQSGWWGHWPGILKPGLFLFWHLHVPLTTALFGYLPGPLWNGADVPKGVAREWAWWGRHRDYLLRDGGVPRRAAYAGLRFALRAYAIERDGYAPDPAVRALAAVYSGTRSEVLVVGGRDVGRPRLGHFDAFRSDPARPFWSSIADWLEPA